MKAIFKQYTLLLTCSKWQSDFISVKEHDENMMIHSNA